MELKLQSILFPDKEEYTDYADLFYKGGLGIRDKDDLSLSSCCVPSHRF